jgi:hypothetical protein
VQVWTVRIAPATGLTAEKKKKMMKILDFWQNLYYAYFGEPADPHLRGPLGTTIECTGASGS